LFGEPWVVVIFAAVDSRIDFNRFSELRWRQPKGRIQSAERAVPTLNKN
jgi:hypothetical protein